MQTTIATTLALTAALTLTACATSSNYDGAMSDAVKAAKNAAQITDAAERDRLRAEVVGAYTATAPLKKPRAAENAVCGLWSGPAQVTKYLDQFADAADVVDKVAKKPDDSSVGAILHRWKDDDAAIEAANAADDLKKASPTAEEQSCTAVYLMDIDAGDSLEVPPTGGTNEFAAISAIPLIKTLVESGLGDLEQLKREEAVRKTIKGLSPKLHDAVEAMASPVDSQFGQHVGFKLPVQASSKTDADAVDKIRKSRLHMNETKLGATVTIERWYEAQLIRALWDKLAICRTPQATPFGDGPSKHTSGFACLADPQTRADVDQLVNSIYTYRTLYKIDTDKQLADLRAALKKADDSTKQSLPSMLNALIAVVGAFSSLSDDYDKILKSK